VVGVGFPADEGEDGGSEPAPGSVQGALDLKLSQMDQLREAIYAKMVTKVGSRTYWDQWAKDIAAIAANHITRITTLVDGPDSPAAHHFSIFLDDMRRHHTVSTTRD